MIFSLSFLETPEQHHFFNLEYMSNSANLYPILFELKNPVNSFQGYHVFDQSLGVNTAFT